MKRSLIVWSQRDPFKANLKAWCEAAEIEVFFCFDLNELMNTQEDHPQSSLLLVDERSLDQKDADTHVQNLRSIIRGSRLQFVLCREGQELVSLNVRSGVFAATLDVAGGAEFCQERLKEYFTQIESLEVTDSLAWAGQLSRTLLRCEKSWGLPSSRLSRFTPEMNLTAKDLGQQLAYIDIQGEIEFQFLLSFDSTYLREIAKSFLDNPDLELDDELASEVLYETTNQIIGQFKNRLGYNTQLGIPQVIQKTEGSEKISKPALFVFESGLGEMKVYAKPSTTALRNRFLVVDDVKLVRKWLIKQISKQDPEADFIEAEDGEEACWLYRLHKPHIVITDYHMPKMNGLEMAINIRDFDPMAKVILTSADMKIDFASECRKIGILGTVQKQGGPVKLHRLISDALPLSLKQI